MNGSTVRVWVYPAGSPAVVAFVDIYRVCFVDVRARQRFEAIFAGSTFTLRVCLSLLRRLWCACGRKGLDTELQRHVSQA